MSKSGITRRGFSLAAGGLAAAAATRPAFSMLRSNAAPAIDLVLYDERFSAAWRFAGELARQGVATRETGGDLGALWLAGLRHELGTSVKRIAGMGRHSDFWIMQSLAAEKGLKLAFYGEHDFRGRKAFTHRLPVAAAEGLEREADWARHVAQHLDATEPNMARADVVSAMPAEADHPGMLVSWVFA